MQLHRFSFLNFCVFSVGDMSGLQVGPVPTPWSPLNHIFVVQLHLLQLHHYGRLFGRRLIRLTTMCASNLCASLCPKMLMPMSKLWHWTNISYSNPLSMCSYQPLIKDSFWCSSIWGIRGRRCPSWTCVLVLHARWNSSNSLNNFMIICTIEGDSCKSLVIFLRGELF